MFVGEIAIYRHVAPHAGARVEILEFRSAGLWDIGRPSRRGASRNTNVFEQPEIIECVAPHAGARVEIYKVISWGYALGLSPLTQGRE